MSRFKITKTHDMKFSIGYSWPMGKAKNLKTVRSWACCHEDLERSGWVSLLGVISLLWVIFFLFFILPCFCRRLVCYGRRGEEGSCGGGGKEGRFRELWYLTEAHTKHTHTAFGVLMTFWCWQSKCTLYIGSVVCVCVCKCDDVSAWVWGGRGSEKWEPYTEADPPSLLPPYE